MIPSGASTPNPPFLSLTNRKASSFQAKQKLKFVEWEKMNMAKINSTVWGHLESDITPDNSESLDHIVELQLAQAGVFEDIERVFAQKPVANIQINRRKERVQVLDSKKSYNLSKSKERKVAQSSRLCLILLCQ